jgi:hypothetical protein
MNNHWPDVPAPTRLVTAACLGEVLQCGTKTETQRRRISFGDEQPARDLSEPARDSSELGQ